MPLFDAYIFVDWSAANEVQPQQPIENAVWSGELITKPNYRQQETYHRTRNDCFIHVIATADCLKTDGLNCPQTARSIDQKT